MPGRVNVTREGIGFRMTAAGTSNEQPPITRPAAKPVVTDPARRPDVLLRKRRPADQESPAWVSITMFLGFSAVVVLLLRWVPGAA